MGLSLNLLLLLSTISFIATTVRLYVRTQRFFDVCLELQTTPLPRFLALIFVFCSGLSIFHLFLTWSAGPLTPTQNSRVIQKLKNLIFSMIFGFGIAGLDNSLTLYFAGAVLAATYTSAWIREKVTAFSTATELPTPKRHQNLFFGQLISFLAVIYCILFCLRTLSLIALFNVMGFLINAGLALILDIIRHLTFLYDREELGNSVWSYRIVFVSESVIQVIELAVSLFFMICLLVKSQLPAFYLRQLYENCMGIKTLLSKWQTWVRMRRLIDRLPPSDEGDLTREDVCIVCREQMEIGTARRLPCGHCFHPDCIERWIGQQTKCPICEVDLKEVLERMENTMEEPQVEEQQEGGGGGDQPQVFRFEDLLNQN